MNGETSLLCPTCIHSIRCLTWAEWKCKKLERRIYDYKDLDKCEHYKKRPDIFKEPICSCDSCAENDFLFDEYEEGD